jgi:tryptophan-rich sensory protein
MNRAGRLEELLATFLRHGTWLASAAIGLGFALELIGSRSHMWNLPILTNMRIARTGIVLFILLPVVRVLLMLAVFIRERDFRFASIAGLVLAIILLAIVLGLSSMSDIAG